METDAFEIQITYPDRAGANVAAAALVQARLAACGQIGAVRSVYRWQGAVEQEDEWLLTAKTTRACLEAAAALIRAGHPYDVPQITALPIAWASPDYHAWIIQNVTPPE